LKWEESWQYYHCELHCAFSRNSFQLLSASSYQFAFMSLSKHLHG
jgi:hypothetical protein